MSLEAILEAIRASGKSQVDEIEMSIYAQVRQILAEARLGAQQEKEEVVESATARAYRERARILHHARLEALRITGNERATLVSTALDRARGHLENFRMDAAYPVVMRRLTRAAIEELAVSLEQPGMAQLHIDPRDIDLLENILRELDLDIPVYSDLNSWGGLIARSQDNRVVVINTLEARLERAFPYLRRYLSAWFEDEHPEVKLNRISEVAAVS